MGMLVLKNSIKAYCASIAIFVLLTLLYAGIIKWTPLPESWSFEGLIVIMSVATLTFGFMEGVLIGKKGIIVGILSSFIFLLITLTIAKIAFSGSINVNIMKTQYIVPLISGTIGAIVGTNKIKS
jgi:putative membrane protein (TIGR04086 family)